MKNVLTSLSSSELINSAHQAVREERNATSSVIEHLREIERRRLYLQTNCASLHDFCVKKLGYSDGAAHRRIRTMQLADVLPQAQVAVDSGELTLSNAALLEDFFREQKKIARKEGSEEFSPEQKSELLNEVSGVSRRKAEQKLRAVLPEALTQEKIRVLTGTESELKIVVSAAFVQKLKRLRELSAHTRGGATEAALLEMAVDLALAKKDPARELARKTETPPGGVSKTLSVGNTENPRAIPNALRREVWQRDHGECQYRDATTGGKCRSRFAIQLDHRISVARDGLTTRENLQLLCANHNRLKGAD